MQFIGNKIIKLSQFKNNLIYKLLKAVNFFNSWIEKYYKCLLKAISFKF